METEPAVLLWGLPEWRGPTPWVFSSERRFQLLAVLALEAGRWVERDRLGALLWPERSAAEALRNLRKVLHDTRALPGLQGLEVQAHALRWDVRSDVQAFLAQRDSDRPAALAWRRGPPLQGLDDPRNGAFTDWLNAERLRLQEAWRDTALAHAQAQDDAPLRAALCRRLLEIDPLDEAAVTLLLRAEAAQGHPTELRTEYQRYAARLAQELGVEPASFLRELVHAAQAPRVDVLAPATAPVPTAPAVAETFIGRRSELAAAQTLLARGEMRSLTVLGPGGVGKSRLARQLLPSCAAHFPGGQVWVELQVAQNAAAALARIAQALGLALKDTADPVPPLVQGLPSLRCLLVLDNVEHLAELAAPLEQLLAAAPQLVLLLTSRQRLPGLDDDGLHERLALSGLAVPDEDSQDLETASRFDAVRLFERCARAAQRDFELRRHLPAVLTIVDAVGGMPLAIELAARWVRLLPPAQVAQDLQGSIDLLERDPAAADRPTRPEHASLRAVLDGTWLLLAPQERTAMAALSVFSGGFTLAAARAVAGCSLPLLSSLADKSLLAVDEAGRFALHPVVATYAAERLAEQGEGGVAQTAVRLRHAEHFARRLDELAPLLRTDQGRLARAVLVEAANMRAAWRAAVAARRADLVASMVPVLRCFFEVRGRLLEGLAELRPALQHNPSTATEGWAPRALARVRHAVAMLHYRAGEIRQAEALAQTALAQAEACGEWNAAAGCLNVLGNIASSAGDSRSALNRYQSALRLVRRHGKRHDEATLLGNIGIVEKRLGRLPQALQRYEEALALARELGDTNATVVHLNNLAPLYCAQEQWLPAQRALDEALALCQQHGLAHMQPFVQLGLGLLALERGSAAAAAAPLQQALSQARLAGLQQVRLSAELGLAAVANARGDEVGRTEALQRLQVVARSVREGGVSSALLVDTAYHYAMVLAGQGEHRRAAAALAVCAAHPAADAARRSRAQQALQAHPDAAAVVTDPDTALHAVVDELLQVQPAAGKA